MSFQGPMDFLGSAIGLLTNVIYPCNKPSKLIKLVIKRKIGTT